ncbi:MAG: cupin domain-containing protein [Nonlabens ulvanivorans]|uniref:cupin domain-containing protein n=1 Tax=Nonlabens ulvanivorans TaxID=906888 RepID=UPI0032634D39
MKTTALSFLLALSIISCKKKTIDNDTNENNLAAMVNYVDAITNEVVFESHYKMIVFALKKGQNLKPHSAPIDAPLLMLEGSATIIIGSEKTRLSAGDIITLPKEIDHGVNSLTDCKFLLLK